MKTLHRSNEIAVFPKNRVILENSSVLEDERDEKLFVRFRFRQYSERILIAMSADIVCRDLWGQETERLEDVRFPDLNANDQTPFGLMTPVPLSDRNSRVFSLVLKDVAYQDGACRSFAEEGEALRKRTPLAECLPREALLTQYKKETSDAAVFLPFEQKTVRSCCCGALFGAERDDCPVCGVGFAASLALLSEQTLEEHIAAEEQAREAALAAERAREEAERLKEEEVRRLEAERLRLEAEERERQGDFVVSIYNDATGEFLGSDTVAIVN